MKKKTETISTTGETVQIKARSVSGHQTLLRLSNGNSIRLRRFVPAGQGDQLRLCNDRVSIYVRNDDSWLDIGEAWSMSIDARVGQESTKLQFKEIETDDELEAFETLRKFHYRGGGGAGRTVPIIAKSEVWDLPSVLGFVEISSSMIANTARRRFLDVPYAEPNGPNWQRWDRSATKEFSNLICRISRLVIHPEIRGLGLAKHFSSAAREYARDRWHYGGYRPRFLEITADMLRYYPFVDSEFAFMGETEGNEHRLTKDMLYLVKKALSDGHSMPQGGGGIMTLQRGYATQLIRYLEEHEKALPDVVQSLRYDPSQLDQTTWEALYRLNRRPKPSYSSGLTPTAKTYVERRRAVLPPPSIDKPRKATEPKSWLLTGVSVQASSAIAQTSEARLLQDAFGFVGATLSSEIIRSLTLEITRGELSLVCGASGAGKSFLLQACAHLLSEGHPSSKNEAGDVMQGRVSSTGKISRLPELAPEKTALEHLGRSTLGEFLRITAKCGLAEPQLFVRPIRSLSSGQRYRLKVALAFLPMPDIIIIDNFCEPLDRFTAIAVVRGLKSLSVQHGVAVLAATANYERLMSMSEIDQTILLRRGDQAIVAHRAKEI